VRTLTFHLAVACHQPSLNQSSFSQFCEIIHKTIQPNLVVKKYEVKTLKHPSILLAIYHTSELFSKILYLGFIAVTLLYMVDCLSAQTIQHVMDHKLG